MDSEDVGDENGGSSLCLSGSGWSPRVSRRTRSEAFVECKMAGPDVNMVCNELPTTSGYEDVWSAEGGVFTNGVSYELGMIHWAADIRRPWWSRSTVMKDGDCADLGFSNPWILAQELRADDM